MERFLADIERRAFRMADFATGHSDEALDIVQDSMIKLVEKYSQRDRSEWKPLFYRILQNRINDWHKKQNIRRKFHFFFGGDKEKEGRDHDPIQTLPDNSAFDPQRMLASELSAGALEEAIRALPLRQQQAFLLRHWEGLDVNQTAQAMGCSEGSVKTHCSRAIASLRDRMGELL